MTKKSANPAAQSRSGSLAFDYANALVDRRLSNSYRGQTSDSKQRTSTGMSHSAAGAVPKKSKTTR